MSGAAAVVAVVVTESSRSLLNETQTAIIQLYDDALPVDEQLLTAWTLRHGPFETAVLCVAYAVVFVVGVLGNIAVIWIVMRTPQLRTTTNQFIVSLAAADLMVNCLCLPFTLVANLFKGTQTRPILISPCTRRVCVCLF